MNVLIVLCDRVILLFIQQKHELKKSATSWNRTRVFCVEGEHSLHYTTESLVLICIVIQVLTYRSDGKP